MYTLNASTLCSLRHTRGGRRALLALVLASAALTGCSSGSDNGALPTPLPTESGSGGASPGDGGSGNTSTGGGQEGGSTAGEGDGSEGGGSAGVRPVVYVADEDLYDRYELYMASPTAPGTSIRLSPALPDGGDIDTFSVTPSGESVVYVADQAANNFHELFIVDLANPGNSIKLNAPLGSDRDVAEFVVSPDGSKVVYRADQNAYNVWELFVVDVANPGVATKLNPALASGGRVRDGYLFSPDGTQVAYRADQDVVDTVELYLVNLALPGVSHQVNPNLPSGGNVYPQFKFSPDGNYLGYVADQEVDQKLELYAVHVASLGSSMKLNGPMVPGGDVCTFIFSPDSTRVAYCADQDVDERKELYTTELVAAGASVKLNPPLVEGGHVTHRYAFGADSSFVAYTAHQDSASQAELYRVGVAAPGAATKLSGTLVPGGSVDHFSFSPDGTRIAYMANQDNPSVIEIYEVNLASPGNTIKMSGPSTGVYTFAYEDDQNILYLAIEDDTDELYRVAVDAPGVSTRLNGELVPGGEVWEFAIVP